MPTPSELLLMSNEQYQEFRKEQKRKEKQLNLSNSRFSYVRGTTKKQQRENVKKYHKAIKRYYALKEKIKQKKIKNIKRIGRGIYRLAKAIPSQRYSEVGRARLISNLRRNAPAEQGNILNTPNIFLKKTDKRKKYSLL